MAERVGFEPTVPCGTLDFESSTFDLSDTSPQIRLWISPYRRTTLFAKKSLHRCSALFLPHTRSNRQPVIQCRMLNDIKYGLHCAGAKIRTAINQTIYPAHYQSACTHRTRFYRNIQGGSR